jgi:uncharacterized protein
MGRIAVSGFFGGLSGHQGALRSTFLIRSGLTKKQFVTTGVVCACLVDLSWLIMYGAEAIIGATLIPSTAYTLVLAAAMAACAGALVGTWLLKKVTFRGLQLVLSAMMIAIGAGLASGLSCAATQISAY